MEEIQGIKTDNLRTNVVAQIDMTKVSVEQLAQLYPNAKFGNALTGVLDGKVIQDVSTGILELEERTFDDGKKSEKYKLRMKSGLLAVCPQWSERLTAGNTVYLKKATFDRERVNDNGEKVIDHFPFVSILPEGVKA